MTEVRDLTQHKEEAKEKKPIEFEYYVVGIGAPLPVIKIPESHPEEWQHVDRIAHIRGYDIFHAWDDDESEGVIYIGHFNDGVV